MTKKSSPISIINSTVALYKSHSKLFAPFIVIAFFNLLILEVLYFLPRQPLASFFSQITNRIWGEQYLHYPMDLMLLPKLYYYGQLTIYIFIGCVLLGACAHMVASINNDESISFRHSLKKSLGQYLHIVIATVISLLLLQGLNALNNLLVMRAYEIRSGSGAFFWLKKTIIFGSPYIQFFFNALITALLVYVIPIIVIERKKIFSALLANFKFFFKSFWLTVVIVLLPNLLYLPIILLRNNVFALGAITGPEVQVWIIVLSILVASAIDLFIVTAATINYLFIKENS